MGEQLTDEERHVMEHTTGWKSRQPLYRNRFIADETHGEYPIIEALCARGLMKRTRGPSAVLGMMSVFAVTDAGIALLREPTPAAFN